MEKRYSFFQILPVSTKFLPLTVAILGSAKSTSVLGLSN